MQKFKIGDLVQYKNDGQEYNVVATKTIPVSFESNNLGDEPVENGFDYKICLREDGAIAFDILEEDISLL